MKWSSSRNKHFQKLRSTIALALRADRTTEATYRHRLRRKTGWPWSNFPSSTVFSPGFQRPEQPDDAPDLWIRPTLRYNLVLHKQVILNVLPLMTHETVR
jgi:hypothetical protein